MLRRHLLLIVTALVAALGLPAQAQDKSSRQAEVKAKAMQALDDFYKADPKLKAAVAKAPGYAVFTTFGLSFGLGGAGGKGIAHDNKSGKDAYMNVAQASAGLQIGASDTRYLMIFHDAKAFATFVDKGWDASAAASAGAGDGDRSKNAKAGAGNLTGGTMHALTKAGLQVGAAVSGLKAWKDGDLN
jgi:lipid-binding SYLF domain-containing protein